MTEQQRISTTEAVATREPDRVRVDGRDDLAFATTTPDAASRVRPAPNSSTRPHWPVACIKQ